jgi:hypothetical protein
MFWLIVLPAVEVFAVHVSSLRLIVSSGLIMLPVFLLGGYLTGRWRWDDFEKKYPNASLPPWER